MYLLDDPLSAVDARVCKHLFQKCIVDLLLCKREAAVVLVTHQVQHLRRAEDILVMGQGGKVLARGDYRQIKDKGQSLHFGDFLDEEEEEGKGEEEGDKDGLGKKGNVTSPVKLPPVPCAKRVRTLSCGTVASVGGSQWSLAAMTAVGDDVDNDDEESEESPKVAAESVEHGSVRLSTYARYLSAGNSCMGLALFVFLNLATHALYTFSEVWMGYWVNMEEEWRRDDQVEGRRPFVGTSSFYLSVFVASTALLWLLSLARTANLFSVCARASVRLHADMFSCLLRAPPAFFDAAPSGRVLNRFSKDAGAVDELLPAVLIDVITVNIINFRKV